MGQSSSSKIDVVQAMRGIAALLVVFWHGSRFIGPYGTGVAGALFQPGASMGVDLFFLISGFIMVLTTRRSSGTASYAASFLIKRFARVWPVYVVATGLLLAFSPIRLAQYLSLSGIWHLAQDLSFLPLRPAETIAPVFVFPALPVGWTLNYEMYFYVILAASLLFGRLRWVAFSAWLAFTLIAVPRFFAPVSSVSLLPSVNYGFQGYLSVVTNPIVLLFAAGVLICLIYQSSFRINSVFFAKLAMFLTVSLVVFQSLSGFRADHGLTNWGLTLAPLLLVYCVASKTVPIRVPRVLVYLGDISYSLYLFHPFAQEAFDRYDATFAGHGPLSGIAAFFVTSALAISIAAISHRYLELGLANKIRDLLLRTVLGNRLSSANELRAPA
jgi:exopolysaccharide production protein ExoZ